MRRWWQWIVAGALAAEFFCAVAGDARAQFGGSDVAAPAPPLPWAKPLKGGSLHVAAIFPQDGSADLAALEVNFDIRLALFPFSPGAVETERALADALKEKADVLLVSSVSLAELSETTSAALAARIGGGAGLLWIAHSTGSEPELKDFLEDAGLSQLSPAPDFFTRAGGAALSGLQPGLDQIFAYTGEKSRAVELRFWKPRPRGHALIPLAPLDVLNAPTAYDNYIAAAGGALRWAAGRDPEVLIAAIEDRASSGPSKNEIPPQLPAAFVQRMKEAALPGVLRPFAVRIDRPAPRHYTLRVQARYAAQPIRWSYTAEERLPKGAREARFNVPIGADASFLDVWIMDGLDTVDWFTQPLNLPAPPELGEVSFGAATIDANDRLRASVEVRKDLLRGDTRRAQPATVYLRVTDALGRVVAMKDVPVMSGGAIVQQELALVDLIGPYAHAELFAAPVVDAPLSWWIRERAAYRAAHLSVRRPLPDGLAIIVDEAGEGSFAGSARRKEWAAAGVEFICPDKEPDLGNIAADGMRIVARLGAQEGFPGDRFDARSIPGVALRQSAARYAAARPGLYTVNATAGSGAAETEKARAAIEQVVRETDPKAAVALLDGEYSAAGTSGFLVLPAEVAMLNAERAPAAYVAVRTPMPSGESAAVIRRWLPWLAAIYRANALWISPGESDFEENAVSEILAEASRVKEGYDVLLRRVVPSPLADDAALALPKNFAGVAARFTLGEATLYALLADPGAESKVTIKLSAPNRDTHVYIPTDPATNPARGATVKLQRGEAAVAVLLPYEVTRIEIGAPASVPAGRRLSIRATVKTRGALAGDHVLRFQCFNPLGKPLAHYSRTVFAKGGAGVAWIPVAFNDPPGAYRVVVRDVLTGIEAEAEVIVTVPE